MAHFIEREDGSFQCRLCTQVVGSYKTRWRHYRDAHLEAEVQFNCPHCTKPYETRQTFQNHLKKFHNVALSINKMDAYASPKSNNAGSFYGVNILP